jgi:predicted DCC family thiol-disulfide oxidoreductase YuxK
MIEPGKNYLLFDGDCGVCTWSSEIVRQMDRRGRFIVEPYQRYAEQELRRFGINYPDCDRALQVITHRGRVYPGAFGVNYFLWQQFPWSLLVGLIYVIPVFLLIELISYRLIANNRGRISQWFGLNACSLGHAQNLSIKK